MYATLKNKDGSLKHSQECKMVFGRKDADCPRCIEMLSGAPSRDGWQKDFFITKKKEEEARINAIKNHRCEDSGCSTVCCTFGDY